MLKPTISIIINKKSNLENFLRNNLKEIFNNTINIKFYYINNIDSKITGDLILVMIKEKLLDVLPYVDDTSKVISVVRTLNKNDYSKLKTLSGYSNILVVNDTDETTMNLTSSLYKLGFDNLNFIPYFGSNITKDVDYCITANESHLIPEDIPYLDIGYRPIDISTIFEIIHRLHLNTASFLESLETYCDKYLPQEKTASTSLELNKQVNKLSNVLSNKLKKVGFVTSYSFDDIKTKSHNVTKIVNKAKKLSAHDINILITGETGTGKEMFAQSIHNFSHRCEFPFIGINVSAIPSNLLESELFGYVSGAFTGSKKSGHEGIFQKCNGGTLFLDEIGDMPLALQTKLLRAIEEKQFLPIGGSNFISFDVRLIAATNKDLKTEMTNNTFRKDLYYRLNAASLKLIPLRSRICDIEILIEEFLKKDLVLSDIAMNILKNYSWEGNIRELKNVCNYISIMCDSNLVTESDLPDEVLSYGDTYTNSYENSLSSSTDRFFNGLDFSYNLEKIFLCLKSIKHVSLNNASSGRNSIKAHLDKNNKSISESEIKGIFSELKKNNLLIQSRGRRGAVLNKHGEVLLKDLEEFLNSSTE